MRQDDDVRHPSSSSTSSDVRHTSYSSATLPAPDTRDRARGHVTNRIRRLQHLCPDLYSNYISSVLYPSSIPGLATPWTYFLHLSLSSNILTDSSTGSPVHVLMLSIQAVRGLPRLRAPGVVPCIISFSRQLPNVDFGAYSIV